MAIEGEQADPRVAAPPAMRPVIGFSRLSAAAYATIARVIDDDGTFRARVAESADEAEVGRAGWLWLHRPVGWLDDPAITGAEADARTPEPKAGGRGDQKEAARKLRKAAAEADAARKRSADQLAAARRTTDEVRAERDALAASVASLQEERNAAVRRSKQLEADLAAARRDLKVARRATLDAEVELQAIRAGTSVPAPAPTPGPEAAEVDRSMRAAATAAADLAALLADAVDRLPAPPASAPKPTAKRAGKGAKRGAKRSGRVPVALPPGAFDGTPEAHRHLIADAANVLVVDGYNVARAAWSGLAPEEERRRTVALLEDVQARSGGQVVVVFDGDDAVTAPRASRRVQVRYSATGQTADDAIVDLLGALPPDRPVVVVSSDRAVAADARKQGATAMGSAAFLAAAGR